MNGGGRLWIVGSDALKRTLFGKLARGVSVRFSHALQPVFYEQLASERAVMRVVGGKPVRRFERIKGMRAESLDATCYSWAARNALNLSPAAFAQRADELQSKAPPPPPTPTVIRSSWMERGSREPW